MQRRSVNVMNSDNLGNNRIVIGMNAARYEKFIAQTKGITPRNFMQQLQAIKQLHCVWGMVVVRENNQNKIFPLNFSMGGYYIFHGNFGVEK